jgi:hypothetical protein
MLAGWFAACILQRIPMAMGDNRCVGSNTGPCSCSERQDTELSARGSSPLSLNEVKVISVQLRLEDIPESGRSVALKAKDRIRVDVVMTFAQVRLRVRKPRAARLKSIIGQMEIR